MKAKILVNRDFIISPVDPRLFGGFAEHLGRCIYGGLYEPGHPKSDEEGFRTDVLGLIRDLKMPVVRYPGGNFVSGYNWEDGIGPKEKRPRRLELAWKSTETNQFGTNEFVDWCRKAGTEPMIAVNMGTCGPDEARNWLEYCNHPKGTYYSDLRREHGWEKPHGVKLWCVGNEMDGSWQICHKTAVEYARAAHETAKVMKWVDPSIELILCGSSYRGIGGYATWEAETLFESFYEVDYVSIHTYFGNSENDTPKFLSKPDEMNDFIREVAATCDYVSARRLSDKRINLSFDEYNVWFHSHGDREKRKIKDWDVAPPILEDIYTMEDALVVGGILITLLNNADRVKIGCIAQIVNVIGAIMTENNGPAWRQTIYWPLFQASNLGRGTVLRQVVESPTYSVERREKVPYLQSACVLRPETGGVTVFALNRNLKKELELTVELQSLPELKVAGWQVLRHKDLKAVNSKEQPDRVKPEKHTGARLRGSSLKVGLPPASWNVICLEPRR